MERETRQLIASIAVCNVVCVLLFGLLSWWAKPYLDMDRPTCHHNLSYIDWAKNDWAVKNRVTNGEAKPKGADLFGRKKYMRWAPECPEGGQYTVGRLAEKPRCSLPEHVSDYGDVHVSDESGQALAGATVQVRSELSNAAPWEFRATATGTNGVAHACFNLLRADDLAAFKAGYATSSMTIPQQWPAKLVLKRL